MHMGKEQVKVFRLQSLATFKRIDGSMEISRKQANIALKI
jgi:hypothetical protein